MQAIHVTTTLDSETLSLPELRPFVGRQVEIFVWESLVPASKLPASQAPKSLMGSVLAYDDPLGPAVDAEEWEACR